MFSQGLGWAPTEQAGGGPGLSMEYGGEEVEVEVEEALKEDEEDEEEEEEGILQEVDLDSYQATLEEVLTWLLSAEDTLHMQDEVSDDVEEVKDQFHTHEVRRRRRRRRHVGSVLIIATRVQILPLVLCSHTFLSSHSMIKHKNAKRNPKLYG